MHIREFTRHDASIIADLHIAAFWNDEFWAWQAPRRHELPHLWRDVSVQRQRRLLLRPDAYSFVCVADAEDSARLRHADDRAVEPGTVLGYARWERQTPTPSTDPWIKGRKASMFHSLERGLRRMEALYEDYVTPNPVIDREVSAAAARAMRDSSIFERLETTPHWYLGGLAVSPEFQGKGVAGMLVRWGLEQCLEETKKTEAEETPDKRRICALIARPAGRWLYEKQGFRALCTREGEGMTFNIPGATQPDSVMIWDPTGAWTEESGVPTTYAPGLKDYVRWREDED